jgi:uncharacterized protein (DUF58 family)
MRASGRLVAFAALGFAFAILTLFVPQWRPFWWSPFALALLLSAVDAAAALARPRLRIARPVPEALVQGRRSAVELEIDRPWPRARIRIFDGAPTDFRLEGLPLEADLRAASAGGGRSAKARLSYSVTPLERGISEWERGWAEVPGPLGLVLRRERVATGGATRVYPEVAGPATEGMRLPGERGSSYSKARRRGHGLEFEQLREYRRGDPPRLIDGPASSRLRRPIVREMRDEEDQTVVFLLDTGYRMTASEGGKSHFDRAFEAMLALAGTALRQGDRVGALVWGATERWIPPRRGIASLPSLVNALYDLQARPVASDPATALREALPRLKRRSLVVLLTNFREEDGDDMDQIFRTIQGKHLLVTVWMREKVVDEAARRRPANLDEALETAMAMDYVRERDACRLRWEAGGVLTIDATPEQLCPSLIQRYWDVKKSGAL